MHGFIIMGTFMRGMMTKHTWSGWPIVITWIHLKMPGTCKEALLRKWSNMEQQPTKINSVGTNQPSGNSKTLPID